MYYHSVAANREGQGDYISQGLTTDAQTFEEQMRILRQYYHPVTMDDIADGLTGSKPLPPHSVAVTFDDGFEDNYTVAAPAMEKYDIRGTFYLTVNSISKNELPWFCRTVYLFKEAKRRNLVLTDESLQRTWNFGDPQENRQGFLQYSYPCAAMTGNALEDYVTKLEHWFGFKLDLTAGPRMMSFAQAKELQQRGHIIGNHTFSHGNVAHIPPETLHQEIAGANEILERELGGKVKHFSYPHPCLNPQWNEQSLALTQQVGFRTAVLTEFGTVTKTDSPLLLKRVNAGATASEFRWRLENAFAGRKV